MQCTRKLFSCLAAVILTMAFLPSSTVSAQSVTVTIFNGETVVLESGTSIPASNTDGIPVAVKNLSENSPPGGLAGFTFIFAWDSSAIRVDSIELSAEALAGGWSIVNGPIDNTAGSVTVAGFTTNYVTSDITLFYTGITAIGEQGASTIFGVDTAELIDMDCNSIDVVPTAAMVRIVGAKYITVTPPSASLETGETQQYFAEIIRSDGLKEDITELATWASNNEKVVKVQSAGESHPGLATGVTEGITTLSADYEGIRSSVVLIITPGEEKPEPVEDNPDTSETIEPDTPVVTENEPEIPQEITPEEKETGNSPKQKNLTKIAWIIGGVVAGVAVLGFLGFTFFTRPHH